MRRLGVSIYPEKSSIEEIFAYLKEMSEIGAKRIFSCLLSVLRKSLQRFMITQRVLVMKLSWM